MSTRFLLPTLVGMGLCFLLWPKAELAAAIQGGEDRFSTAGFAVEPAGEQIDLATGTSRSIRFDFKVPHVFLDNTEVLRVTPVADNEFVIAALKPGIATLRIADVNEAVRIITVNVTMDIRKLELALKRHFPASHIRVYPLQQGVLLGGTVSRADDVDMVLAVAKDFIPMNVINRLQVDGSQVVATEVRIYEVSRTKLRNMGVDWSVAGRNVNIVSGFADVLQSLTDTTNNSANASVGIVDDATSLNLFINLLEQRNLAKLMAQPTLTTQNGRPAEFLSGGEIPFQVNSGFGNNSIQFRPFGTKLDLVPIVHGEGELTLEIRAEISEVANDLSAGTGVPGFRVRRVNTGVPMRSGQTLALAGDYREKVEAEVKGAPGIMNKAGWGSLFRNTRSEENETELVFVMTPRFVNSIDAGSLPDAMMPGRQSTYPSNRELFFNGHIEVPVCPNGDCGSDSPFAGANAYQATRNTIVAPQPFGGLPVDPTQAPANQFEYPAAPNSLVPAYPAEGDFQNSPSASPDASYFQPGGVNERRTHTTNNGYPTPAATSSRVSQKNDGMRR